MTDPAHILADEPGVKSCACDFCTGVKSWDDNWCPRCGKVQMQPPKWHENMDVCDACDAAVTADASDQPCGNEDCDACYPLPRFKVSRERVQRITHERTVKAKDEADAIRIVEDGTAWPSSYDDRYGEIIEQGEPVATRYEPQLGDVGRCWKIKAAKAGDA